MEKLQTAWPWKKVENWGQWRKTLRGAAGHQQHQDLMTSWSWDSCMDWWNQTRTVWTYEPACCPGQAWRWDTDDVGCEINRWWVSLRVLLTLEMSWRKGGLLSSLLLLFWSHFVTSSAVCFGSLSVWKTECAFANRNLAFSYVILGVMADVGPGLVLVS